MAEEKQYNENEQKLVGHVDRYVANGNSVYQLISGESYFNENNGKLMLQHLKDKYWHDSEQARKDVLFLKQSIKSATLDSKDLSPYMDEIRDVLHAQFESDEWLRLMYEQTTFKTRTELVLNGSLSIDELFYEPVNIRFPINADTESFWGNYYQGFTKRNPQAVKFSEYATQQKKLLSILHDKDRMPQANLDLSALSPDEMASVKPLSHEKVFKQQVNFLAMAFSIPLDTKLIQNVGKAGMFSASKSYLASNDDNFTAIRNASLKSVGLYMDTVYELLDYGLARTQAVYDKATKHGTVGIRYNEELLKLPVPTLLYIVKLYSERNDYHIEKQNQLIEKYGKLDELIVSAGNKNSPHTKYTDGLLNDNLWCATKFTDTYLYTNQCLMSEPMSRRFVRPNLMRTPELYEDWCNELNGLFSYGTVKQQLTITRLKEKEFWLEQHQFADLARNLRDHVWEVDMTMLADKLLVARGRDKHGFSIAYNNDKNQLFNRIKLFQSYGVKLSLTNLHGGVDCLMGGDEDLFDIHNDLLDEILQNEQMFKALPDEFFLEHGNQAKLQQWYSNPPEKLDSSIVQTIKDEITFKLLSVGLMENQTSNNTEQKEQPRKKLKV